MAPVTRLVMFILWPVAWPVSRVLHYALGPHQGTVYRRAELKELVNMHAATKGRGDLNNDTIVIVGGALDLQEKVAKQAMTPIDDVFMLPYTAKLDYATLEQVVRSGHSRIPIYAEVEVPVSKNGNSGACTPSKKSIPLAISAFVRKASFAGGSDSTHVEPSSEGSAPHAEGSVLETVVRKKIIGMLLVKQTVLLDPEDATPIADLIINALPTVPADEPLLNVLNAFQEGRSHMAIVSSRPRKMGVAGSKRDFYDSKILGDIDEEKQVEGSGGSTDTLTERPHTVTKRRGWRKKLGLEHGEEEERELKKLPTTLAESMASDFSDQPGDGWPLGIITLEVSKVALGLCLELNTDLQPLTHRTFSKSYSQRRCMMRQMPTDWATSATSHLLRRHPPRQFEQLQLYLPTSRLQMRSLHLLSAPRRYLPLVRTTYRTRRVQLLHLPRRRCSLV